MAKNKILDKVGKVTKQKADELVKEYTVKAKGKVSELLNEYTEITKNKAGELIDECVNGAREKATGIVNETIDKGTHQLVSKGKGQEIEEGATVDSDQISPDEYNSNQDQLDLLKVKECMTDEDDDEFVNGITSEVLNTGLNALTNPGDALTVINNLAEIAGEVEKFREVQKTKRVAIEADKQVVLSKLHIQKKLLMEYLDKTFDERRGNFNKLFDVIDDALIKGNIQQLAVGLNSMNELAKSSPFKDLANINQVGKALEDENHEWDF